MSEKVDKLISIFAKNSKIIGFLDGIASCLISENKNYQAYQTL